MMHADMFYAGRWLLASLGISRINFLALPEELDLLLKQTERNILQLRPNTASCPHFSAVIFVCAENMVKIVVFASWLTSCYISARTA